MQRSKGDVYAPQRTQRTTKSAMDAKGLDSGDQSRSPDPGDVVGGSDLSGPDRGAAAGNLSPECVHPRLLHARGHQRAVEPITDAAVARPAGHARLQPA